MLTQWTLTGKLSELSAACHGLHQQTNRTVSKTTEENQGAEEAQARQLKGLEAYSKLVGLWLKTTELIFESCSEQKKQTDEHWQTDRRTDLWGFHRLHTAAWVHSSVFNTTWRLFEITELPLNLYRNTLRQHSFLLVRGWKHIQTLRTSL